MTDSKRKYSSVNPTVSICTLPPLSHETSLELFRQHLINCRFDKPDTWTDVTDKEIQEYIIKLFATLSVGHGRSIEVLVSECNNNKKNNPVNVTKVILDASKTLTRIRMKNPYFFFQLILLGDLSSHLMRLMMKLMNH